MALQWDVSKIKDYKDKFPEVTSADYPEPQWNPITMAIIWHGLNCGFHTITQDNYVQVFARIKAWETAFGASLTRNESREQQPLTLDDIKGHIGLWTNTFPDKTLNQFKKHLGEVLYREALNKAEHEAKPKPELVKA